MKLQVTLKQDTLLHKYFKGIVRDRADEARRLMERGLRAGSIEQIISQTLREGLADLSVVTTPVEMPGDGVEDPTALAALGSFLGDIDDEGDDI